MKKSKKVLTFIFKVMIIFYIIHLLYNIYLIFLMVSTLDGNYSKKKMQFYFDEKNRINYFEKNKDNFTYIADLFENNPDIDSIGYKKYILCSSLDKEIEISNDRSMCVNKDFNGSLDIDKLKSSLSNLSEIIEVDRREDLNDNYENETAAISFYIISSARGSINYNYCISFNTCDSKDDYREGKDWIFIKDNLDERWSSIYDTTPLI